MTHSPDHAERAAIVAAGLTKAQRDLVTRLTSQWSRTAGAGKGLYKAASLGSIVEIEWTRKDGRYRQRAKLTDLGLAVRASLHDDTVRGEGAPTAADNSAPGDDQ